LTAETSLSGGRLTPVDAAKITTQEKSMFSITIVWSLRFDYCKLATARRRTQPDTA
jgi:hypothetical protein